jgi:dihydropteroate synthase
MARSIRRALAAGVPRTKLIIDPGLGFGKTRRQNYAILAHLERLHRYGLPLLVGTSRKSFVQAVVAGEGLEMSQPRKRARNPWPVTRGADRREVVLDPDRQREARGGFPWPLLLGDAGAVAAAILAGTHIVRVHDVAGVLPAVRIADAILAASR